MKKLLILVLILGLTSAANAAISYTYGFTDTAGGAITSAPSDEDFVFTISRDTITGGWSQLWRIYDAYEASSLGSDVADFSGAAFGPASQTTTPATIPAYDVTYDGYLGAVAANVDPSGTEVFTGGVMLKFTLTPSATGTFTMYNLDSGYSMIDSASINIVPEPMTIALLGLGGLFLRRRK